MKSHEVQELQACELCNMTFSSSLQVEWHYETQHLDQKEKAAKENDEHVDETFICGECSVSFTLFYSLPDSC